MLNLKTGRQTNHWAGNDDWDVVIDDIQTFEGSNLVLTTAFKPGVNDCRILILEGEVLHQKLTFDEERFLDFSQLSDDRVVGTCRDGLTTLWDLQTGQCSKRLLPTNIEDKVHSWNRLVAWLLPTGFSSTIAYPGRLLTRRTR